MWKCRLVKFCLVFASLLVFAACSTGDTGFTKKKCGTTCHGYEIVKNKRYSESMWRNTVTAMVTRGAKINAEEQERIVKYLTKKYGI